jgi:hypothetical protein
MDTKQLQTITHANHTSEIIMTGLSMRERARSYLSLNRIKRELLDSGEKIVSEDFKGFWKSLEDAGYGVVVYGRKNRPSRFMWHYNLKEVAKHALSSKDAKPLVKVEPKAVKRVVRKRKTIKGVSPMTRKTDSTKELVIPFRNSFTFNLTLPADFSKEEAKTIAIALERIAS